MGLLNKQLNGVQEVPGHSIAYKINLLCKHVQAEGTFKAYDVIAHTVQYVHFLGACPCFSLC